MRIDQTRPLRVFHDLSRAYASSFRAADRALKAAADLSATQTGVLFCLLERDGTPISAIADSLKLGKSSLTGLIDRMASAGLVRRETDVDDARVIRVFIEQPGAERAKAALAVTRSVNAALLADFSPAEQATISRFLEFLASEGPAIVQSTVDFPVGPRERRPDGNLLERNSE